jgi:hypothetical protein
MFGTIPSEPAGAAAFIRPWTDARPNTADDLAAVSESMRDPQQRITASSSSGS